MSAVNLPKPDEVWDHAVYGKVTVVEVKEKEIELKNASGQWRLAVGWDDPAAMLKRMGKKVTEASTTK